MSQLKLYGYFRSSAAFRVRIALNLKALPYETVAVHLLRGGGDQFTPDYRNLNPEALVPTLIDGSLPPLSQSLAIIEYLEETHPTPPLLPSDVIGRARVRSLALAIACDIHPLNNLRVLRYLAKDLGIEEEARNTWYRHWIADGLAKLEADLVASPDTGRYCYRDEPGMADCCLVPQIFNAKRYSCDLAPYPCVMRIFEACMALDAFQRAQPSAQAEAAQR